MENSEDASEGRQTRKQGVTLLGKVIAYLLAIIAPGVASFYIGVLLTSSDKISYIHGTDNRIVLTRRNSITDISLDDHRLSIGSEDNADIRVLNFTLINDNSVSLAKGLRFLFFYGDRQDKIVPREAVFGHRVDVVAPDEDSRKIGALILSGTFSPDPDQFQGQEGYGIEFLSAVPGNTALNITVLMNLEGHGELVGQRIVLRMPANISTVLERTSQSEFINIHIYDFLKWIVLSMAIFGSAWLGANIYTRNYSCGAVILNWIFIRLFGKGFIKG